jgi:hypothetical protein
MKLSRKNKHAKIKLDKRLNKLKYLSSIVALFSFFIFAFSSWTVGTYSWFTASASTEGKVQNAKKEDLVNIVQGNLYFSKKCVAYQKVTVTNITNQNGYFIDVIITIEGSKYTLKPGESIEKSIRIVNGCKDFGTKEIIIVGYQWYFDHVITVDVTKQKLCPPASENGQGANNDNGNGMHCGNNDENKNPPGQKKDNDNKKNNQIPSKEPTNNEAPTNSKQSDTEASIKEEPALIKEEEINIDKEVKEEISPALEGEKKEVIEEKDNREIKDSNQEHH